MDGLRTSCWEKYYTSEPRYVSGGDRPRFEYTDQASMSAMFRQVSSAPGIAVPFHVAGPVAFYSGLFTLVALLTKRRVVTRWNGTLTALGIVAVGTQAVTGYALLGLAGFAGMTVELAPVARSMITKAVAEPAESPAYQ